MTWSRIYAAFLSGLVLFFMNWWMLDLSARRPTLSYMPIILLLMSGMWISRMLKHNLMEDVFNTTNEFHAGNKAYGERYSVNLPTKFVYQGKEWDWMDQRCKRFSCVHRNSCYAVVNNYIKQQIEKSFLPLYL